MLSRSVKSRPLIFSFEGLNRLKIWNLSTPPNLLGQKYKQGVVHYYEDHYHDLYDQPTFMRIAIGGENNMTIRVMVLLPVSL